MASPRIFFVLYVFGQQIRLSEPIRGYRTYCYREARNSAPVIHEDVGTRETEKRVEVPEWRQQLRPVSFGKQ
jgi:hypothetical protein